MFLLLLSAWMGNQQFTASGLHFEDAETAMQIHWDWGWTMQDIVIENCQVGLSIVGPVSDVKWGNDPWKLLSMLTCVFTSPEL